MKKMNAWIAGLCLVSLVGGFAAPAGAASDDSDKKMCEKYQERLKKYEKEGVMGINPATGKVEKMTGEQAKSVIEDTRENVKIFCN